VSVLCFDRSFSQWQFVSWLTAGLFTLFGTFLIWSAYYRWLAADID